MVDIEVNPAGGEVQVNRVEVAHDGGLIINPVSLTNQIDATAIQANSRTLEEAVSVKLGLAQADPFSLSA